MQRFSVLEGFRAVLAWWVVLGHMLGHAGYTRRDMPDGFEFLRSGEIAVFVFMIISGFVITHLMVQKEEPYKVYIMRRFLRLWPVFAVLITVLFALTFTPFPIRAANVDNLWIHYLVEMTMLHGLFPDQVLENSSQTLGGPGWSISLEWQFYIIAPLFLAAFLKPGWPRWVVLGALLVFYMLGMLGDIDRPTILAFDLGRLDWDKPSAIFLALPYFAFGMLSYWVFRQAGGAPKTIASALIIALLLMTQIEDHKARLALGIWIFIMAVMASGESPVSVIFDQPWLRWLGEISYSTYILHMPVLLVVRDHVMPELAPRGGVPQLIWTAVIAVPIIIAISTLSYYRLEKPAIDWGRRLAKKWTAEIEAKKKAGKSGEAGAAPAPAGE